MRNSESLALTSHRASSTVKYLTRAASTLLNDLTLRQAPSDATRPSRKAWLSAARKIVHVRFADDFRLADGFLGAVERAVLLRLAGLGACTRQCLGKPGEPLGQHGGRQRRYLNVAECRIDVRLGAVARIHTTLAVDFEELEIAFDGGSHRQRACDAIGKLCATHHA